MFRTTIRSLQFGGTATSSSSSSFSRAGLPHHHLPAGSNLSTLTALSLGLQIVNPATAAGAQQQQQECSAPSSSPSSSTTTFSFFPTSHQQRGGSRSATASLPLSWRLPSQMQLLQNQQHQFQKSGFGGASHRSAKTSEDDEWLSAAAAVTPASPPPPSPSPTQLRTTPIRAQEALDALQSPAHVLAPLPLDAAVLCLGVALADLLSSPSSSSSTSSAKTSPSISNIATAIWNYPVGCGKLLSRFVEVLQTKPKSIFPKFGSEQRQSPEAISKVLVDVVRAVLDSQAATASAVPAKKPSATQTSLYAAVFVQDQEFFKASAKIVRLYQLVITSSTASSPSSSPSSSSIASSTPSKDSLSNSITWFLDSSIRALQLCGAAAAATTSTTTSPSPAPELAAFADICDLCCVSNNHINKDLLEHYANSLLSGFNKVLHQHETGASSFYLDVGDGISNLMMLLMLTADAETNDFADQILSLWFNVAQHTRAAYFASSVSGGASTSSSRCRSAVVGALAMTNRSSEAFDQEEKMFEAGFVLDPQAQLVLIRSVANSINATTTAASTIADDNLASARSSSHNATTFILRKELAKLYNCARTHWCLNNGLDQVDVNVRLALLQMCWDSNQTGRIPASVARTFFPKSFVLQNRRTSNSSGSSLPRVATKLNLHGIIASGVTNYAPNEILCILLRSLTLLDGGEHRIVLASSDRKSRVENELGSPPSPSSSSDPSSSTSSANSLLDELNVVTATALDEVVGSSSSNETDAELWGCIVGAAAACGCRSVLIDTALALKAAQPTKAFVEMVMLTAIDCLRARDWHFSKLVVAELSRALAMTAGGTTSATDAGDDFSSSSMLTEKVLSRLLARQQEQQRSLKNKKNKQETTGTLVEQENIEDIVQEFFGGGEEATKVVQ